VTTTWTRTLAPGAAGAETRLQPHHLADAGECRYWPGPPPGHRNSSFHSTRRAVRDRLQATASWSGEERWNAPLISKVAKVTSLAGQHVQFEAGAGPVFASSASAASWRFRFTMVFLFPR